MDCFDLLKILLDIGEKPKFTCDIFLRADITHNQETINTVSELIDLSGPKMVWKIGDRQLKNTNEFEKVNALFYDLIRCFCKGSFCMETSNFKKHSIYLL